MGLPRLSLISWLSLFKERSWLERPTKLPKAYFPVFLKAIFVCTRPTLLKLNLIVVVISGLLRPFL